MNEVKKHLFWIILGVVLLGGIGAWFFLTPSVAEAKSAMQSDAQKIKQAAVKPAAIITPNHVKALEGYKAKMDSEKGDMLKTIQSWPRISDLKEIEKRFKDVPAADKRVEFDTWMLGKRQTITKTLTDGGVHPPDLDKILFAGQGVDDASLDETRHRDYRLRKLALVEDVVAALLPRDGKVNILKFETDKAKEEPKDTVTVGAIKFDNFTFRNATEVKKASDKAYDDAQLRGGRTIQGRSPQEAGFKGVEMPVMVTAMEIEFTGHISCLTPIMHRLETTANYFGVVSKVDFERIPPFFPGALTDTKVQQDYAKAEYKPTLNTHYGESAVKMYVAVDLYEFDQKKFEAMDKPPAPPTPPGRGNQPKPPAPK